MRTPYNNNNVHLSCAHQRPATDSSPHPNKSISLSIYIFVGEWGWEWGKQVGSMNEESQVRGCCNITFICTNQETVWTLP